MEEQTMKKIRSILLSALLLISSSSCKQSKEAIDNKLKDHIKEIWDITLDDSLSLMYYKRWKPDFNTLSTRHFGEYIIYDCLGQKPDLFLCDERSEAFQQFLIDKTSFILKDEKKDKSKPKVVYQDTEFINTHHVDQFEGLGEDYSWFYLDMDYTSMNAAYGRTGIRIYDPTDRKQGLKDYLFMYYINKTSLLYIASIY